MPTPASRGLFFAAEGQVIEPEDSSSEILKSWEQACWELILDRMDDETYRLVYHFAPIEGFDRSFNNLFQLIVDMPPPTRLPPKTTNLDPPAVPHPKAIVPQTIKEFEVWSLRCLRCVPLSAWIQEAFQLHSDLTQALLKCHVDLSSHIRRVPNYVEQSLLQQVRLENPFIYNTLGLGGKVRNYITEPTFTFLFDMISKPLKPLLKIHTSFGVRKNLELMDKLSKDLEHEAASARTWTQFYTSFIELVMVSVDQLNVREHHLS
ncbi:MAG: hypothetical protein Q9201_004733 [Fulgogasparrea decipioides]